MPRAGAKRGFDTRRKGPGSGLVRNVFELIDMRSFSNLWFWIALAVLWSSVSHWVLGVPWDMVMRARKDDRRRPPDLMTWCGST